MALAWLLEQMAGVEAGVAYGGIVGRAENRAFVKVLRLPVVPLSRVVFDELRPHRHGGHPAAEQGNHSLPAAHFPDVVIDHHPERPETRLAVVADVGRDTGATSTVVTDYLRASGSRSRPPSPPPSSTASSRTPATWSARPPPRTSPPTSGSSRKADTQALSQIEQPRLPEDYFRLFHAAVEKARLHGDAVTLRPRARSTTRTWSPRWPTGSSPWAT